MLKLNITWKDRRLDFLNLRDDIYQNILPDDEKEKVWIPKIGMNFSVIKDNLKMMLIELLASYI